MKLTLPYPPSANRYWRHNRGRIHRSTEAVKYIYRVQSIALAERVHTLQGPVSIRLDVYRPERRGDLDNTLKVLIDALRTHAYHDDKQIEQIVANRYEDKHNPRVEVVVEAATERTV